MTGTLRLLIAIAVLLAAGYGVFFLWTGTLPPHTEKVAATYGIIVALTFILTLITKPAGEKH